MHEGCKGEMRNAYKILVEKRSLRRPKKQGVRLWIWFIWLKIGSSGGFLWTWSWSFVFHKRWGNFFISLDTMGLLKKDSVTWWWRRRRQ